MSELFDSEFLKKIQQLVITSKLVLSSGAGGNRKSRAKGSSVEFSDYREYSEGDDYRRIDWNAYGRFEKLFIKLFMEEREAPIHIFLDTSGSMDWGSPNKNVSSRRLAAALSYISLSNYDRVSICCISDKPEKSKLSLRGKNSFPEVLSFLENAQYGSTTDLYAAISGCNIKSNRGISIIISDLTPPTSFSEIIKYLQYRKQEVIVCHMLSPQEIEPEVNSDLRLLDMETNEHIDITASPHLIRTYKKVYEKFISDFEETCFKRGVSYFRLVTSMPIEQMVREIIS